MSAYTQTTNPMVLMYVGYQDLITMLANGHFCKNFPLARYRLRAGSTIFSGRTMHRVPNEAEAIATRDKRRIGT